MNELLLNTTEPRYRQQPDHNFPRSIKAHSAERAERPRHGDPSSFRDEVTIIIVIVEGEEGLLTIRCTACAEERRERRSRGEGERRRGSEERRAKRRHRRSSISAFVGSREWSESTIPSGGQRPLAPWCNGAVCNRGGRERDTVAAGHRSRICCGATRRNGSRFGRTNPQTKPWKLLI